MTNLNTSGNDRVSGPIPVRDRGTFASAVARIIGYDGSRGEDVLNLVQELANESHRLLRLDQMGRSHGFETATDAMNELGRILPPSLKLVDSNMLGNFSRVSQIEIIPEPAPQPVLAIAPPVVETKKNTDNPRNLPLYCKSSRPLQAPRAKRKKKRA